MASTPDEQLDDLEARIDSARKQAQDDGLLPDEDRPSFFDPDGDRRSRDGEDDDPMIATP